MTKPLIVTLVAIVSVSTFAALTTPAMAARAPDALVGKPALEVANGPPARTAVGVSARVPARFESAWRDFLHTAGGTWTASWDRSTGIPGQVYGSGLETPGAVASESLAKQYATNFLRQHLDLLAPGSRLSDFRLVSNEEHRGIRSVGFVQSYGGLRVVGGQVSMRFKADRLVLIASQALPFVSSKGMGAGRASDTALRDQALAWILRDRAATAKVVAIEGPMLLPIVSDSSVRYQRVMAVWVDGLAPRGRWRVYLDAGSSQSVAREQTLRFDNARVEFNAPIRQPLSERAAYPARRLSALVDGISQVSSESGAISWSGTGEASVAFGASGPLVAVTPDGQQPASATLTAGHQGNVVWDQSASERIDAQLSAFVHAGIAKEAARRLSPGLTWLDEQLPVLVNIDDTCNAFSDGNSINFYVESSQCANTARLADVVYHEFGHSLHAHSIIEGVGAFDGAFSEGLSDYFAASITDDPAMAPGFFKNDAPLRNIDPASSENVWPDDIGEIHFTGLIFAGAMWDLRKVLRTTYGTEAGARMADQYFYGAVQRAANIPATYAEILLEDDDDGNLANGTPNICDINVVFGLHGLRAYRVAASTLSVENPLATGYNVQAQVTGLLADCPGDRVSGASLRWELRGDSATSGVVAMEAVAGSTNAYHGEIPATASGEVVRYSLRVEFADGSAKAFPQNPADPFYEFYVGSVVPLYCTDFETDPFAEGWSHGLSSGDEQAGADDWTWGAPHASAGSGDPSTSFSGSRAVGNDLGGPDHNGLYQPDKTNFLLSPKIDVGKYSDIRLQYRRWLNVEDGFFDQGSVYANGQLVWSNFNSDDGDKSTLHHQDQEWRFHDVPLTGTAKNGSVQIKFELSSDGGLELGGWTIDDFCVVANVDSICGDAQQSGAEECDDGQNNSDTDPDACRSNCLAPRCGDGIVDTGESCDDGNTLDGDGCQHTCLLTTETGGDCGCYVGNSRPWSGWYSLLALLGLLGLLALRRRSTKGNSAVAPRCHN